MTIKESQDKTVQSRSEHYIGSIRFHTNIINTYNRYYSQVDVYTIRVHCRSI